MEAWQKLTSAIFGVIVVSAVVLTEPMQPTATDGEALFHDSTLGKNGKSCATCHPGGKGLEGVSEKTGWSAGGASFATVEGAINACVRGALEGPSLSENSYPTKSLALYLAGFEKSPAAVETQEEPEEDDEEKFGC